MIESIVIIGIIVVYAMIELGVFDRTKLGQWFIGNEEDKNA